MCMCAGDSAGIAGAGDYVVCGDSSYVASKPPRWSEEGGARETGRRMWSNVLMTSSQSPSRSRRVG